MNPQFDRNNGSKLALDWRVLGILNLYRVLVPLVLVSLYSLGGGRGLAVDSPQQGYARVRQKDLDLANLAELSQYIVQHLRESLLVVDAADKTRLINESAAGIWAMNMPCRALSSARSRRVCSIR